MDVAQLGFSIDPRRVLVVIPTLSGDVVMECVRGLMAIQDLCGGVAFTQGNSNIALCRNISTHNFESAVGADGQPFEHMVLIDADIGFTREDFLILLSGDEDVVIAEYARKEIEAKREVQFGMGFARVSRKALERVRALADEKTGERYVPEFYDGDKVVGHYHQDGVAMGGAWMGEDQAFWHLVRLAGVTPRIETRTKLLHIGRMRFPYKHRVHVFPVGASVTVSLEPSNDSHEVFPDGSLGDPSSIRVGGESGAPT